MAFVERYILNTCASKSGKAIKLVLLKNQETVPTPIIISGTSAPIKIKYKDEGSNPLNYIIGSECELNLVSGLGFTAEDLYTENEKDWQVDIYIENVLYWRGFVLPEGVSKPYADTNYDIRIIATDGLGKTKDIPYSNGGILYRGFDTQKNILAKCLATLGLNIDISIFSNTFETQMNGLSSPLNQLSINQDRFIDVSNSPLSVKDVLESILIPYSARLFQVKGNWVVETILEKAFSTLNGFKYNSAGALIGPLSQTQTLTAGGVPQQMAILDLSHSITTENALKDATAYYQYGFIRNSLSNGDFSTLDGSGFFLNWLRVSSEFAVVDNTYVYDSEGNPILSGYRLWVLKNSLLSGDAVQSETISVRKNEKVSISFNASVGVHSSTAGNDAILKFKIIDDDGLHYTGPDGWKTEGTLDVVTASKDFNDDAVITFYIDIPARAEDYNFSFSFGAWIDDFFGEIWSYFDNFRVQVEVDQLLKPPIGSYVTKTQFNTFTSRGDTKVMLFGDDSNDLVTSQMLVGGNPTALWKRLFDANFLPLLSIVADTDLKLNSRPKLLFDADFFTEETISMQTMVEVEFLTSKFIIITGDFDLINETHHLRLIELLADEVGHDTFYGIDTGNYKDNKGASIGQIGGITTPGGSTGGNFVTKWQEWESTFKAKSYILPTAYEEEATFEGWQIYIDEEGGGGGITPPVINSIATLTDVFLTDLADEETLKWDASISKWVNATGGGGTISALTDVALTGLSGGQALRWDDASSKWVNYTRTLASQTDVVLTGLSGGQALRWDNASSKWINYTRTLASQTDVVLTGLSGGQALRWDNASSKWVNYTRTLASQTDVVLTSLTNGQALRWNNVSSKWVNYTRTLASQTDVVITSIQNNQVLKWDSITSRFINAQAPEVDTLQTVTSRGATSNVATTFADLKVTTKMQIPEKAGGSPTGSVWEIYVET